MWIRSWPISSMRSGTNTSEISDRHRRKATPFQAKNFLQTGLHRGDAARLGKQHVSRSLTVGPMLRRYAARRSRTHVAAGITDKSARALRKAAATCAAENGATAHELMAIFGCVDQRARALSTAICLAVMFVPPFHLLACCLGRRPHYAVAEGCAISMMGQLRHRRP
jgi:hypothetical protein